MNPIKHILQILCVVFLSVLFPMTSASETSFYVEGLSLSSGEDSVELTPSPIGEFRYTRVNSLPVTNLDYFWRVGCQGSSYALTYDSASGISHAGGLGLTSGAGLSLRVEKWKRWTFTPFLGVFYSNWWNFSGRLDHVPTAEVGIEIDVSSKFSLVGMYAYSFNPDRTVNAFQIGISFH